MAGRIEQKERQAREKRAKGYKAKANVGARMEFFCLADRQAASDDPI